MDIDYGAIIVPTYGGESEVYGVVRKVYDTIPADKYFVTFYDAVTRRELYDMDLTLDEIKSEYVIKRESGDFEPIEYNYDGI